MMKNALITSILFILLSIVGIVSANESLSIFDNGEHTCVYTYSEELQILQNNIQVLRVLNTMGDISDEIIVESESELPDGCSLYSTQLWKEGEKELAMEIMEQATDPYGMRNYYVMRFIMGHREEAVEAFSSEDLFEGTDAMFNWDGLMIYDGLTYPIYYDEQISSYALITIAVWSSSYDPDFAIDLLGEAQESGFALRKHIGNRLFWEANFHMILEEWNLAVEDFNLAIEDYYFDLPDQAYAGLMMNTENFSEAAEQYRLISIGFANDVANAYQQEEAGECDYIDYPYGEPSCVAQAKTTFAWSLIQLADAQDAMGVDGTPNRETAASIYLNLQPGYDHVFSHNWELVYQVYGAQPVIDRMLLIANRIDENNEVWVAEIMANIYIRFIEDDVDFDQDVWEYIIYDLLEGNYSGELPIK